MDGVHIRGLNRQVGLYDIAAVKFGDFRHVFLVHFNDDATVLGLHRHPIAQAQAASFFRDLFPGLVHIRLNCQKYILPFYWLPIFGPKRILFP